MKTQARARVALKIEINVSDLWEDGCPIQQVYDQAEQQAIGSIRRVLVKEFGASGLAIEAIGVETVLVRKER